VCEAPPQLLAALTSYFQALLRHHEIQPLRPDKTHLTLVLENGLSPRNILPASAVRNPVLSISYSRLRGIVCRPRVTDLQHLRSVTVRKALLRVALVGGASKEPPKSREECFARAPGSKPKVAVLPELRSSPDRSLA
jgi:hypothetical protein